MTVDDLRAKTANAASKEALTEDEVTDMLTHVPEWVLDEDGRLVTNLEFENFVSALAVVNDIGVLAEEEGHHPDLLIYDYKNVGISLSTDEADNALTERDFVLAAKIDALLEEVTEDTEKSD